ncbi:inositol hexakisphosphate kinase 3 isoform X2 [Pseudophryne corroboree]|uniref:inositol hexakisphosphate kinase 3 isoform X2 n=1 Tax=Pseudophryne corroboree TaxID=495146 RepID=UPI0030818074
MGIQGMEIEASIHLVPLSHQVGGHTSMLVYDSETVCKPLVSQEQRFYESLPREMRNFTPKYKGIISVSLRRDSRGHLHFIANPSPNSCSTTFDTSMTMWHKVKQQMSVGADLEQRTRKQSHMKTAIMESCSKSSYRAEKCFHSEVSCHISGPGQSGSEQVYNPWGLHCHQQHLSRMFSECHQNKLYSILLEACYKVYKADNGQFLCRDKYYGRKLSREGFRQALYTYLHNGYRLRSDLLEPIIFQLKSLKSVLETQGSYRFYSSSLLMVYEGKDTDVCLQNMGISSACQGTSHGKVDVRMIDFAHTTFTDSRNSLTVHEGPDHGYIFGLENLVKILCGIRDSEQQ